MTESDLVTVLGAFVGNRVFPDTADLGTPLPYIIYQQVGGQAFSYLGSEVTDKKPARIQIRLWSETRAQAMTTIRQIENALVSAPLHGMPLGAAIATYDENAKLRGALQDFSFWIT